ncbi:MAG: TlpA family protein disulfide reductase [Bryobacteraceae bacterium]
MRAIYVAFLSVALAATPAAAQSLVAEVRAALDQDDFPRAERLVEKSRQEGGITPLLLEAHSWLGRGALAAKDYDRADRFARETYRLSLDQLKSRKLDDERHLPIALGAAIEVLAHSMAGRGDRSEAVHFLNEEMAKYRSTSIRTRIQKNIHLLSLEGKAAPAIETGEHLNRGLSSLASLKGKPVLLFFWAHWCSDCKYQAPILARIEREYGPNGLVVVGPTQRYGYTRGGADAEPAAEVRYIEEVRKEFYSVLPQMPVPVSEENFRNYGVSTTPTLVLLDRAGIVRMYNPGKMTYEALEPRIRAVVGAAKAATSD